jgi:hypothetical protein
MPCPLFTEGHLLLPGIPCFLDWLKFMKCNKNPKRKKIKKIAIFLPSARGGGAEKVLLTLIKHLSRKKYQLVLI